MWLLCADAPGSVHVFLLVRQQKTNIVYAATAVLNCTPHVWQNANLRDHSPSLYFLPSSLVPLACLHWPVPADR